MIKACGLEKEIRIDPQPPRRLQSRFYESFL